MDSDSIFYGIFIVVGIIFSVLDSRRKAKQKQESSRPTNRPIQPPPVPVAGSGTEREDDEDWFDRDDDDWKDDKDDSWNEEEDDDDDDTLPQSVPTQKETSLLEQLKHALKDMRQDGHSPSSTPPPLKAGGNSTRLNAQSQTSRSITFETPEMEGQRATTDTQTTSVDEAYNQSTDSLPTNSNEWKKAIIAHEILKRKF